MAEHRFTNALIQETSPYLLQHAHNPVNWYPWTNTALLRAQEENKLLLISIGYSACHWCHVMEKESFEDEQVASILNDHFICIKVDREERPDIDQVYMDAIQLMNGHGGWPLNCIALPDQRPIYGGTYFRKKDFVSLLLNLLDYWNSQPAEALEFAEKLHAGIIESGQFRSVTPTEYLKLAMDEASIEDLFVAWHQHIDDQRGGLGNAPKFPLPNSWLLLLRYSSLKQDKHLLLLVELTLNKMAYGGIYDQLGGGFSRYSTDAQWKVPHFEKMLYDNAQLVSLYAEAFQKTQRPLYQKIVFESLAFIKRELNAEGGGFFSALDADSEGVEGKYYVWTKEELEYLLGSEEQVFSLYYQVRSEGNWEGTNILHRHEQEGQDEQLASRLGLSTAELMQVIRKCNSRLLMERARRIPPNLDDKMLCAWNALTVKAYADAYWVFRNPEYLDQAQLNLDFLLSRFSEGDRLFRSYKNGKVKIPAFLDDYVFLSEALIEMYKADYNATWLFEAGKWMDLAIARFYDEEKGMFMYSSKEEPLLIANKQEVYDHVIPSSNSVAARVLLRLGKYLDKDTYVEISHRMLQAVLAQMKAYVLSLSNWEMLLLEWHYGMTEVVVCGKNAPAVVEEFAREYLPLCIFIVSSEPGSKIPLLKEKFPLNDSETLIYLCKNKTCQLPVSKVSEALELMKDIDLAAPPSFT